MRLFIKINDTDILTLNKYKTSSAEMQSSLTCLSIHTCASYRVSD